MSGISRSLLWSCNSIGPHLQLLNCLGLLHQNWEFSDPQGYEKSAELMFQSSLVFSTSPLLRDSGRIESCKILQPIYVCLHSQVPLLECEEFSFPPMFGRVGEVFLQESRPERSPGHCFLTGLHHMLHAYPPIFCICHQQEGDKGQLLCISALYHFVDLHTLYEPRVCLIKSGFARVCAS